MGKVPLSKLSFKWHNQLAWVSLVALLLFAVSAITHPILSWTGPKAVQFRPPSMLVSSDQLNAIALILERHDIESAQIIKLVPSNKGNVLQVTELQSVPRRYFELKSGKELVNFDKKHALWLANYYLGNSTVVNGFNDLRKSDTTRDLPLKSIEFKTEFDSSYPWVNRLLPVYRVQFADKNNTSVYIYTELNALASMGNDYKTQMQAIFRNVHTWSWLNDFEYARIIVMGLLLVCAFLMILAGIGLLLLRKRSNARTSNKIHRALAYIVAIPLLGFCSSGFYHLLHYGLVDTHRGMVASNTIDLRSMKADIALFDPPNRPLNHVALISHQGSLFYRLSISNKQTIKVIRKGSNSNDEHAHHSSSVSARTEHFKGNPLELGGLYYSALSGEKSTITDNDVAIELASQHLMISPIEVNNVQLIQRFGPTYDFRNKRLPIWQVDFDTAIGDTVFVDPSTGTMVDHLVNKDRYEGYSFSFLHKWNFLTPLTGRFWRDVLMVLVLSLTLIVSVLGLTMKLRRR